MKKEKDLGHMSIDPMTGMTVFVKPGEQSPAEKREQQKKDIISMLRQYVNEHSNGPQEEETDPMVRVCNDAADMLQATVWRDVRFSETVKLEKLWNRRRFDGDYFADDREEALRQVKQEAAKEFMNDILHSGLVTVKSAIDTYADRPTTIVQCEMYVGVTGGRDVNDMLANPIEPWKED